jgi:signal transduction histidine kinase/ligand-binding sensor domain-containing protein
MRGGSIKSRLARRAKVMASVLARLILSSLLATPLVLAQLHSLDVSQYLHTSWTAQEGYFRGIGVSNNGIAQTADGYIWFLSSTGVFRFDGARFMEWKPPNGESFPGAPPSQMLASRDGSLWIAGHGVAQIRADGTWHRYHELDTLDRVRLAEDKDGVIWAGAENSPTPDSFSLFRIDRGKVSSYKLPEFLGLGFTPLFVDRNGRLWADTEKGIWRILPGPPKLVQKKTLRSPAFSEDSTGALLYEQAGRIRKLSAEGTSEDYLGKAEGNPLNVRAIFCDKEGGLWIGTMGQGIVHLHEGHIDHFTSLDGLSSDVVESIFQDREGNVWVTSPESIDKFTKPAVPRLTRKQGLSGDSVYSVLTDRRGKTWIGTSNGFNELAADHVTRPGTQFHNDPGLALIETHAGRILMTTLRRGQATVPNPGRIVIDGSGMFWLEGYKNVFSFAEDAEGTLWAVSQQLGLLHLRENGDLIEALSDPTWGDYALSVAFDPKRDGIWFTTHNGKVFFLKGGKILERYGRADGLGNGTVRVLHVDDDGGVWMATPVGLAHLRDHKVSILGLKNGLPCDRVHWMQRDRDHHVWLYTGCGLVSFSEHDLSSWIAQPSRSVTITDYLDNTEGVQNTAIGGWYTPLSAMTRDGRILFAMRTGLGLLDPRHLNQNALPPPVYIDGITADGREIENTGHASLPTKTGTIHIAYTALSFAAPRKVRFRYKLQGYDQDWSEPVSLREVNYTNLPPGDYQFRVIACNNDGVWNETGADLAFTIPPAFYQTRWFLFLCLTALICLLWLILRWRMKQVTAAIQERAKVRADERVRIARDLHDTLLQGVQGLTLLFHVAAQELPEGSRTREAMERALATARRLVAEGRDRVNRLRPEHFTHKDLTNAFEAIAADLNYEQRVRFDLKIEGRVEDVTSPVLNELHYIGREAISNAFRHSEASEIAVRLMCGPKGVVLTVADNGNGFDPEAQEINPRPGHWGLRGMNERAEVIGAQLKFNSMPNKGTEVVVTVPADRAYGKRYAGRWQGSVSAK